MELSHLFQKFFGICKILCLLFLSKEIRRRRKWRKLLSQVDNFIRSFLLFLQNHIILYYYYYILLISLIVLIASYYMDVFS